MSNHRVQFYDSDDFLVKTVLAFIEPARGRGDGVIVIANRNHLAPLQAAMPLLPDDTEDCQNCLFLDAHEMLATFMVDGRPDKQRFDETIGSLIRRVSLDGTRAVSAYGEMVAELAADGNTNAAVQLEHLWTQLAQQHHFNLLCAYPHSTFSHDGDRHAFECICAAHTHVNPIERVSTLKEPDTLHRTIALLQQRAHALESELRQRQAFERALQCQNERIAAMTTTLADLEKLAAQDPLTGLSNRRIFNDRLDHAVERATRTGGPLALIFIDIDDFKALNDTHGHTTGDCLLKQIAERLSLSVRTADTVCRWGGDEFAVIIEDTDAEQASVLMERIVTALREHFTLGVVSTAVSASVGISRFPEQAASAQALLEHADAAMYRAKRNSKMHLSVTRPGSIAHLAAA